MSNKRILICGAGGFIGGHLVANLRRHSGVSLRAVDVKPFREWHQIFEDVENLQLNLQRLEDCERAVKGCEWIYNLAADMGGLGFIESNKGLCMLNVLINTHLLMAARNHGVAGRFFYASSACVYNTEKQQDPGGAALREEDAYPAMPEDGYGWEKLFGERMCRQFREDFGLPTRIARYHNVYGPHGTYAGGREKAPAAICRKVIEAKLGGRHEIQIWGTGEQTRSFLFVTDCILGTQTLMRSEYPDPLNIGSNELVSIDQLVDIVEEIAGVKLKRSYDFGAPRGVHGRNSDNSLIRAVLNWEPSTRLRDGLELTYRWIYDQMAGVNGTSPKARPLCD